MAKNNLVTNPSFKTNTTGWSTSSSSSIARITTDGFFGTSCLEVTKQASSNSGVVTSSRIAVTGSVSYGVSAYVKVPLGSQTGTFQINVAWYTAVSGGSLISTSSSNAIEITVGDPWVRLTDVITSPSNAAAALIYVIQPAAGTASKTFYLDAVLFEAASYINEYYDDVTQAYENKTVDKSLIPVPVPKITGMQLNADIILNGLILNTIDEDGVVWVCTGIDGWWNHPEPDIADIPRGYGDGSYDIRGRYQSRQITLNGVFLTPDSSYVQAARDKLIKAADLVHFGGWLKTNEQPLKASWVRLNGAPSIETVNARGRTEFSIGLRAPDPLKYEWYEDDELGYRMSVLTCTNALSPGTGTVTINNTGNAYTPVILEIHGTVNGNGDIQNVTTNELISTVQPIGSGVVVEIDTKEHEVAVDGDAVGKRNYVDVLAEWFYLAPGNNVISFVDDGNANNSSAYINVYYRSAWLG
jgi:hypothetical protein